MKISLTYVCLAAMLPLFCAAETEKVIDYVALNGGTAEGLLEDRHRELSPTYADGKCTLMRASTGYVISAMVEEFEGKSGVLKILSEVNNVNGWNGPAFMTMKGAGLKLSDLHKVKVEYYYAGNALTGQKMRMVVDAGTYFNVESTDGIISGEWATAEFDFASVFETSYALYEEHKNDSLYRTRLYFYDTIMKVPYCAYTELYNFPSGEALYMGKFTYCPQTQPTRAIFEMAGAEQIDDIEIDSEGKVILPTPVREGYEFIGWSDNNDVCEGGTVIKLESSKKFYAIWKNLAPETGIKRISSKVRSFDVLKANGSTWGLVTDVYRDLGHKIVYSGELGAYSFLRMNGDAVAVKTTVSPTVINGETFLKFVSELDGGGWNGPSLELPAAGLTPADVETLTVQYLYNNELLLGNTMTLYFEIDGTWRYVTSSDKIVKTPGTDMASVTLDVKSALGSDFRRLRRKVITAWRLYPYTLDVFEGSSGYSKNYPFNTNTPFTFGKLLLTGASPAFSINVR